MRREENLCKVVQVRHGDRWRSVRRTLFGAPKIPAWWTSRIGRIFTFTFLGAWQMAKTALTACLAAQTRSLVPFLKVSMQQGG